MSASFETGEPFTGPEIATGLARLHGVSHAYAAAIPAPVFIQPQGAKWSPADHVRHLTQSTRPVVQALGLPKAVLGVLFGRPSGPSRSFPALRADYRACLAAGGTAGRYAPAPRPAPADPAAWQSRVLASWHGAVAALQARIGGWPEAALDRYRLPHPLLGRLTVREMLFFTLYHQAHHLNLVASRMGETTE